MGNEASSVSIVCTRRARRARSRCAVCHAIATKLCDHTNGDGSRTCSKALCDRHAVRDGDRDLCPVHARPDAVPLLTRLVDLHETLRTAGERRARARGVIVEQLALFSANDTTKRAS